MATTNVKDLETTTTPDAAAKIVISDLEGATAKTRLYPISNLIASVPVPTIDNASETVKGVVEIGTLEQLEANETTGETGAVLVYPAPVLNTAFSGGGGAFPQYGNNTLFVSENLGNNSQLRADAVGQFDKPFNSVAGALAVSLPNDVIHIIGGEMTNDYLINTAHALTIILDSVNMSGVLQLEGNAAMRVELRNNSIIGEIQINPLPHVITGDGTGRIDLFSLNAPVSAASIVIEKQKQIGVFAGTISLTPQTTYRNIGTIFGRPTGQTAENIGAIFYGLLPFLNIRLKNIAGVYTDEPSFVPNGFAGVLDWRSVNFESIGTSSIFVGCKEGATFHDCKFKAENATQLFDVNLTGAAPPTPPIFSFLRCAFQVDPSSLSIFKTNEFFDTQMNNYVGVGNKTMINYAPNLAGTNIHYINPNFVL